MAGRGYWGSWGSAQGRTEEQRIAANRRKRETDSHERRNTRTERLLAELNTERAAREEAEARQFMETEREKRRKRQRDSRRRWQRCEEAPWSKGKKGRPVPEPLPPSTLKPHTLSPQTPRLKPEMISFLKQGPFGGPFNKGLGFRGWFSRTGPLLGSFL